MNKLVLCVIAVIFFPFRWFIAEIDVQVREVLNRHRRRLLRTILLFFLARFSYPKPINDYIARENYATPIFETFGSHVVTRLLQQLRQIFERVFLRRVPFRYLVFDLNSDRYFSRKKRWVETLTFPHAISIGLYWQWYGGRRSIFTLYSSAMCSTAYFLNRTACGLIYRQWNSFFFNRFRT